MSGAVGAGPPALSGHLLAALLASGAVWLLLRSRPRRVTGATRGQVHLRAPWGALAVAAGVGGLVVLAEGTVLALGLVALLATAGAGRLLAGSRARAEADRRADRVLEVSEALAGELRAGQPPLAALRHAAEVWPELAPVATAGDLGGDVPSHLRQVARRRGGEALAQVAAAWQVSEHSGATMSTALARVADSTRRGRATQRLVMTELASAQATARLVAALPVVVLGLGSGLGGDPWGFLLRTPAGLVCLAAGVALAYAGLAWIDRIATSALTP